MLIERHIELAFASVDAGADYVMLAHLPRPFLVMRTLGSFNHPGPMKSRSRSCYAQQPSRLRWATIRRSAVRPGWPPGPDRSSRNDPIITDSRSYKGGLRRLLGACTVA